MAHIFEEIVAPTQEQPSVPTHVAAYVLSPVLPQKCRTLLKQLALEFPNKELAHLKRVQTKATSTAPGAQVNMSILLGTVDTIKQDVVGTKDRFDTGCDNTQLVVVSVPSRSPESTEEHKEFNSIWPTRYIPKKPEESMWEDINYVRNMQQGIVWALEHGLAVVVDDTNSTLVATASNERSQQRLPSPCNNPLITPILLAIQGVSRLEREDVIKQHEMKDTEPTVSSPRYLLTGLDVYTVKEPTVFEAMALLHARVRRVVFGCAANGGGLTQHFIHCLKLTNHRYRAFSCRPETQLWKQCNVAGEETRGSQTK